LGARRNKHAKVKGVKSATRRREIIGKVYAALGMARIGMEKIWRGATG
jgi:hypothetical protein